MSRKRTIIRVGVITGVVLTVATLAGVGGYFAYTRSVGQEAAQLTADAETAIEQQRYIEALESLTKALRLNEEDVTVWKLYAKARLRVPELEDIHFAEAIHALRRAANLEPENVETQRMLAGLYLRSNDFWNATRAAERLTEVAPQDAAAFRLFATALHADQKDDQALEALDKAIELDPTKLVAYQQRMALMHQMSRPDEEIVEYARQVVEANPSEPRFRIVPAIASSVLDDRDASVVLLKELSGDALPDEDYAQMLVVLLERWELNDSATEVLAQTSTQTDHADARNMLAYRLWQTARYEKLAELTTTWREEGPLDTELLIVHTIALMNAGREADGQLAWRELQSRDERIARLWAPIIFHAYTNQESGCGQALSEVARQALGAFPGSVYVEYYLGLAYLRVGETSLAIDTWRRVAEKAPRWPDPMLRIANTYAADGDFVLATKAALDAINRSPDDPRTVDSVVAVGVGRLISNRSMSDDQRTSLAELLSAIQANTNDEVRAGVLSALIAATNQNANETDKTISKLINNHHQLKQQDLSVLLAIATADDVREKLSRRLNGTGSSTLEQALARAKQELASGDVDTGREIIEAAAKESGTDRQKEWAIAHAQYLTDAGDDGAIGAWSELSAEFEDDLQVQQLAVSALESLGEIDVRANVVDRLEAASNGQGIGWRLARARLMLDESDGHREAAEAATILSDAVTLAPSSAEAHMLLATCYLRLESMDQAIDQLKNAIALNASTPELALRLALLLESNDSHGEALQFAVRAARHHRATAIDRQTAIGLMVRMGQLKHAIEFIELDLPETPQDTDRDFATVRTYALAMLAEGEIDRAKNLIWPLATESPRWAKLWTELAVSHRMKTETGKRWLSELDDSVASDQHEVRLVVARAMLVCGRSRQDDTMIERGHELLASLETEDSVRARVLLTQAMSHHQSGELQEAESHYRAVLEIDPDQAVALNNLAGILAADPTKRDDAESLAKRAFEIRPDNAEYLDTYTAILFVQDRANEAIQLWESVVTKHPNEPLWRVRFVEALMRAGLNNRANAALTNVEELQASRDGFPLQIAARVDQLRRELDATRSDGSS